VFFVRSDGQGHGRVVAALAGGAVAVMLLSGCQGDAEPTPMATASGGQPSASATTTGGGPSASPTAAATLQPSPASSAGPAANLPVPVKPALADENTAEGLEAFTKYWFELFSYGYETNDWAPFEAVTDPGCRTCAKYVDIVQSVYEKSQYIEGGEFQVGDFNTDFILNTQGSVQAFVSNGQSNITFYSASGEAIRTDTAPAPVVDVIFAVFTNDAWVLLDYGKPEGT
jgi:hypothetical protein